MSIFYTAFRNYRRDHGDYPRPPSKLYPRYLHWAGAFTCPAFHPGEFVLPMATRVKLGTTRVPETYFFPYLALHDPLGPMQRDRVPLVVCAIHAQQLYEDSHRNTGTSKAAFIRHYGTPRDLVLFQNGSIKWFNDLDQPRAGIRYLEFDPSQGTTATAESTDAAQTRGRVARPDVGTSLLLPTRTTTHRPALGH